MGVRACVIVTRAHYRRGWVPLREANLSAQTAAATASPRLPRSHGQPGWKKSAQAPTGKGTPQTLRLGRSPHAQQKAGRGRSAPVARAGGLPQCLPRGKAIRNPRGHRPHSPSHTPWIPRCRAGGETNRVRGDPESGSPEAERGVSQGSEGIASRRGYRHRSKECRRDGTLRVTGSGTPKSLPGCRDNWAVAGAR